MPCAARTSETTTDVPRGPHTAPPRPPSAPRRCMTRLAKTVNFFRVRRATVRVGRLSASGAAHRGRGARDSRRVAGRLRREANKRSFSFFYSTWRGLPPPRGALGDLAFSGAGARRRQRASRRRSALAGAPSVGHQQRHSLRSGGLAARAPSRAAAFGALPRPASRRMRLAARTAPSRTARRALPHRRRRRSRDTRRADERDAEAPRIEGKRGGSEPWGQPQTGWGGGGVLAATAG